LPLIDLAIVRSVDFRTVILNCSFSGQLSKFICKIRIYLIKMSDMQQSKKAIERGRGPEARKQRHG
jgi:hypothetical protein